MDSYAMSLLFHSLWPCRTLRIAYICKFHWWDMTWSVPTYPIHVHPVTNVMPEVIVEFGLLNPYCTLLVLLEGFHKHYVCFKLIKLCQHWLSKVFKRSMHAPELKNSSPSAPKHTTLHCSEETGHVQQH